MAPRLSVRSLSTKFTVGLAESSRSYGKVRFSTQRRAFGSGERRYQSARSCYPRLPVEKSRYQKV